MINPVVHFEIPVADMDRAMAFFPRAEGQPGASGALACGDVYVPSKTGPILYFDVPDITPVLARAQAHGGAVLYPRTHVGEAGYVAEIEDSEGNRIALSAPADEARC